MKKPKTHYKSKKSKVVGRLEENGIIPIINVEINHDPTLEDAN